MIDAAFPLLADLDRNIVRRISGAAETHEERPVHIHLQLTRADLKKHLTLLREITGSNARCLLEQLGADSGAVTLVTDTVELPHFTARIEAAGIPFRVEWC